MSVTIALAAGGTGGHLFPALAVSDAIRARRPDARLLFVTSSRELDRSLLDARGVAVHRTDAISFAARRDLPRTLVRLAAATRSTSRALRRAGVSAVCGFGGYPSLPAMLAAARLRIPRLVHEANALPRLGLANRLAVRLGAECWGGFAATGTAMSARRQVVGVPIRESIARLDPRAQRRAARAGFDRSEDAAVVLIVGGSLGAQRLNETVLAWLTDGLPAGLELIWSTGDRNADAIRARLGSHPQVSVLGFIESMELAYAASDVVVARAGASTVAELEQLGLRALLVPLAIARQGEQHRNATVLTERGGAAILEEQLLAPGTLQTAIGELLAQPAPAARPRHGDAADRLAQAILALAEGHR